MFSSFSRERTPNAGRPHVGFSSRAHYFPRPKILKLVHQLIRLANECIEQSEIGIIRDGRIEPVCLRKATHEHQCRSGKKVVKLATL